LVLTLKALRGEINRERAGPQGEWSKGSVRAGAEMAGWSYGFVPGMIRAASRLF
jgi:hypothetical protein